MTELFTSEQWKVATACFQYSIKRLAELPPRKLAYYTTAETALKIIQTKKFWLRNPRLMNDYQEIVHGTQCLHEALTASDIVSQANAAFDPTYSGLFAEILTAWESQKKVYESSNAFIACLSEIDAADNRGAPSMWRAYGGSNGVALILNSEMLNADTTFLNTFHSPVLYGSVPEIKHEISKILESLAALKDEMSAVGKDFIREKILLALEFAMLSIKHVGFAEEKEWRMIHRWSGENKHLAYEGRVVRGNAEVVCEVDLSSDPSLAPNSLFEKIIVGPCLFPENTAEAIHCAFFNQGLKTPEVVKSDIPLRHM